MKIEINLKTGFFENYKDLIPMQGTLKEYECKKGRTALKNSILSEGIIHPTFIWEDGETKYIWDGHGRQDIYIMLESEGYEIPKLPVVYILAKNKADAKIKLLKKEQDYRRRISKEGLEDFLDGESIEIGDISGLNLPGIGELNINFLDGIMGEKKPTQNDTTPSDPPKEPKAKLGDIYQLGNHRLMCGDSTKNEDIEKLMNGEKIDMVFTDPPYNTGMTSEKQAGSGGLWKGKNDKARLSHMFNDSYTDEQWELFMEKFCNMYNLQMKNDSVAYICLDWRRNHELMPHLKKNFKVSNVIIWDKVVHGLGSDYKYTYELINVCKKGKPLLNTHQGNREYSDVWHIQRAMGRNEEHATAKPIELVERCLRHASIRKSIVADWFQGSGTTLIACENLDRICYGMEFNPGYIDVIIDRWERHTGEKAKKLN